MNTKRSIVLGIALAAVVLVAAVGSVNAAVCVGQTQQFQCGDTVTESCTLDGNMNCPAGSAGLIVGADGVTIDGNDFTIAGSVIPTNCEWASETDPCAVSGIYNAGHDHVVIKNLKIENFCTGIALKGSGPNKIMDNTIDNCEIHHNGFDAMSGGSEMTTHGVHACWLEGTASVPALTITNNEIYNNKGTGGGCGDGGNGIFIYAGSPDTKHEYCDISYNNLHHNAKAGFWTKMMLSECEITHNTASNNGGGAGISDDVQGGIILRCKLSDYNLIAHNTASNNGGGTDYGYGIYIGGNYNIIRDNDQTVNGNTADGISLGRSDGSSNNELRNNKVCSNHRYGVYASSGTVNNELYDNYICCNGQKDIYDASTELDGDHNNCTTAVGYYDDSAGNPPPCEFGCDLEGPDLTISDKHETWVNPGMSYTITFTVTNAGNMQAGASNTRVWVNGGVQGTYSCPALAPAGTFTMTAGTINLANPPNPDTIRVCADALTQVTETNENNNCIENKFGAADLVILPPEQNYWVWTDLSWKTYELKYQVKNVGDRATPNDVRVNFTELHGEWKDCVNSDPIPAGLQPGQTTAMLTAGPFVMDRDADWLEEWVNFDYSCPVNYWNVLHHDRTRFTEGYPTTGPCWDVNGDIAKCGDSNLDSGVDPSDALKIYNDRNSITCDWAADAVCDGGVDPSDALKIYNDRPNVNCCEGCERW